MEAPPCAGVLLKFSSPGWLKHGTAPRGGLVQPIGPREQGASAPSQDMREETETKRAALGQPGAAPSELFGNLRAWRGDARCPGCCAWPGCSREGICSQTHSEEAAAGAVSCYPGSAPLTRPAGC